MRAMVSELLPAWNGTISRIGRSVGQPCALARHGERARARNALTSLITSKPLEETHSRGKLSKRRASRQPGRIASGDLLGFPQAFDQGTAQQKCTRKLGVLGGPVQLLVILAAHRRVFLGQHTLVADRLRLRVLKRDVTALPLVAVEHLVADLP